MTDFGHLSEELGIDRDLVFKFTLVYSRFEYALKKSRKYATTTNGKVSADICSFANDHDDQFNHDLGYADSMGDVVKYLESNPPRKQVLRDGELGWDEIERKEENGERRLRWLLRTVRTARNNLFHGGKFRDGVVEDPSRDSQLLECGIRLIEFCVELNEEVQEYYKRTHDDRVYFTLA